ncbi:Zinc finger protein 226 [Plakobranchus ocellatus]|uniref:Zinc finger protein 226 n=1 Tax=Plakobranchus ocellatus TaxID=259542 RepID=A0AAV4ALF3_9GAST|nr:Zinc finger protein 226 [Plakobranchus ocellatus]
MNKILKSAVKHHQFEASQISGVLVYSFDRGPPVQLRFTQEVNITVLVDKMYNSSSTDSNSQTGEQSSSLYASSKFDISSADDQFKLSGEQASMPRTRRKRDCGADKRTPRKDKTKKKQGLKERKETHYTAVKSAKVKQKLHQAKSPEVESNNNYDDENESGLEDASLKDVEAGANKIKCQYCQKEFPTLRHFYDHRRAQGSSHPCKICGKIEPFEANLLVHIQRHSQAQLEESEAKSMERKSKNETKGKTKRSRKKERMKCNVCGLMVSSIDSLKIHMMLHTGESPYCCCVCGEKLPSLSSHRYHMDTHVTIDRFRCRSCNLRFSSRAELARHQLGHQFKCNLCDQVFPNKTSRTCHFRVAHPQDILRCSRCPALFSCAESLEKHMQYHAKCQRQQCPTCGLVVFRLKEHMLLHSAAPQARMFVCDQCPMSYLRKANLERHMRTHTGEKPYACSHCPKRFGSNGMLRKHLLTHTQERPFQCEICGKRCALRSNLAVHMRVHSTRQRFSCPICGQAFNHKNSLQGHIRSKHSKPSSPPAAAQFSSLLADPLAAAASTDNTLNSAQLCGLPQPQVDAGPMQLSCLSPMPTMSGLAEPVVNKGRPDYSHLIQLGYNSGVNDSLLDQTNMVPPHPQPGLSFPSYSNS